MEIAKGFGMIEPNMATLLCFLCADAAVDRDVLRESLAWCVQRTLNCISVDSDQSTSDTVLAFSSGKRGRVDPQELRAALLSVLAALAGDIVETRKAGATSSRWWCRARATRPSPSASARRS